LLFQDSTLVLMGALQLFSKTAQKQNRIKKREDSREAEKRGEFCREVEGRLLFRLLGKGERNSLGPEV